METRVPCYSSEVYSINSNSAFSLFASESRAKYAMLRQESMVYRNAALHYLVAALLLLVGTRPARSDELKPGGTGTAATVGASAAMGVNAVVGAPKQSWLKVRIVSAQPGPNGTINVELDVVAPSQAQIDLLSKLNGQPIAGVATAAAPSADKGTRGMTLPKRYRLTIPKMEKPGTLAIVARSGGVESEPVEARLSTVGLEHRPVLYLLAVGVGRYQLGDIPALRYPPKDARDLADTLQRQKPQVYRNVSALVLVETEATRARLLEGLAWLKKSVTKEDTAVVFLAGHGTNDTDGSYYYLPYDAQADKNTMLAGATLQQSMREIAGRVVLMLDTCHSGNVLGQNSLNRFINDLTTENRIVVFAASTGDQAARESPAWQNGAFTKAVIEGLRGVADYAEDGQITVSELETWTSVRVRQLTSDVQTPTLAKPNATPDYVIAALPLVGGLPSPKQVLRRRVLWGSLGAVAATGILIGVLIGTSPGRDKNVVDLTFH